MTLCKVVYGCCAEGFADVSDPMPYEACVQELRRRWDDNPEMFGDPAKDSHYEPSYDIINAESGRLMSWVMPEPTVRPYRW